MGDDRRAHHDRLRHLGVAAELSVKETPDGRPGVRVLLFAMSSKDAEK